MAVNITWSTTSGGVAISSLSHGNASAGNNTTAQTIYIRHDGNNSITNCKLYMAQKSGSYTGARTAAQDYQELINWGDGGADSTFGGLEFNFNNSGGFPNGNWPTLGSKTPTNGDVVRTGRGDFVDNAIGLPVAAGCPSAGVIPAGNTPNVAFKCRFNIPSSVANLGNRQIDLRLKYTYTS